MKSSNIKPLNPCPMCEKSNVIASYEKNRRYRYFCPYCKQYFEFNAPSQFAADVIYNNVISGKIEVQEDE